MKLLPPVAIFRGICYTVVFLMVFIVVFMARSCSPCFPEIPLDPRDAEGPMLLNKRSVGNGDTFTIYCNRSSFNGVEFPDNVKTIETLAVCRLLNGGTVALASYSRDRDSVVSWNNASAMGWSFTFSGGRVENNVDTIQLNMTFNKASCADAGAYLCCAQVPGARDIKSSVSYLLPDPPTYPRDPQGCPGLGVYTPIINKDFYGGGESFTVTCDASKFYDVHLPSKDILCVSIHKIGLLGKRTQLFSFNYQSEKQNKDFNYLIPKGRNWTVVGQGIKMNTSIVLTVHDAKYQDAGTYVCMVTVPSSTRAIRKFSSPHYLYALDVHYGPQLINKQEVGPNDTFTMTCDVTKFIDKEFPEETKDRDIWALAIVRELEDKPMAKIASYRSDDNSFRGWGVPPGRNWTFSYTGGDIEKDNRYKMSLSMTVNDANCEDAGTYYCVLQFFGWPPYYLSTPQFLQPRAPKYEHDRDSCNLPRFKPSPILNKIVLDRRDYFQMACSAASFRNRILPRSTSFEKIGMVRRLPTDKLDTLIALFTPSARSSSKLITRIPTGRKWTFQTIPGPANANKAEIKIIMDVPDAGYQDAGMYKCIVKILPEDRFFHSSPHVLYPKAAENFPVAARAINKEVIGNNDQFTITCDSAKFLNVDLPPKPYFEKMGIVQKLGNKAEKIIAMYWPFTPQGDPKELHVPEGRSWDFQYGGGDNNLNKDTMKIELIVKDANCDDAGSYKCVVKLPSIEQLFYSQPFTLHPRIATREDDKDACVTKRFMGSSKSGAMPNGGHYKSTAAIFQSCVLIIVFTGLMIP